MRKRNSRTRLVLSIDLLFVEKREIKKGNAGLPETLPEISLLLDFADEWEVNRRNLQWNKAFFYFRSLSSSILRSSYVKTFLGDARVKEVMDVAESGYQCQQVCIASITNLLFVIDYTEK